MNKNYKFEATLESYQISLKRSKTKILQLNMGKICNLTCSHCHVNAGPNRRELISTETIANVVEWFSSTDISILDLTGGTPEMVPGYKNLIKSVRNFTTPRKVITRLNATIIEEDGFDWVVNFLAENNVEIIASMPCYEPKNVEDQRGNGVFDKSISAFQKLNAIGYGLSLIHI